MSRAHNTASMQLYFTGLLFVGLKLTGYISWSWWWVTAPFWAPVVIALPLLILLFATYQRSEK